jgi:hypothetical protein
VPEAPADPPGPAWDDLSNGTKLQVFGELCKRHAPINPSFRVSSLKHKHLLLGRRRFKVIWVKLDLCFLEFLQEGPVLVGLGEWDWGRKHAQSTPLDLRMQKGTQGI